MTSVIEAHEFEVEEAEQEVSYLPARRYTNDLERRERVSGLLRPVAKPDEVIRAQPETRELVAKALQEGRDYGKIPGTNKRSLLKPGAERINAAYGMTPMYRIVEHEGDHDREFTWVKRKSKWENGQRKSWEETGTSQGLYRYVVECELVHRESGVVVGQGIGSCSTMESKYVDRPRECGNVALKMAQKRAFIAATLNTYGLSDQFTQDVEDLDIQHGDSGSGASDSSPTGASLKCLDCGGESWDNRSDKAYGKRSENFPDFKCRDRRCGWAHWSVHPAEAAEASEREASKQDDPEELNRARKAYFATIREVAHPDVAEEARKAFQKDSTKLPDSTIEWNAGQFRSMSAYFKEDPGRARHLMSKAFGKHVPPPPAPEPAEVGEAA